MRALALIFLLLVLAWQFHLGLLVFAGYAILITFLISRALTRAWIQQLTAERQASLGVCEIGGKFNVAVTLRNAGSLRVPWVILEDSIPVSDLGGQAARLQIEGAWTDITNLPRSRARTIQYSVHCRRRGYYRFGPLLAETGDLFGLHRTYRLLTEPHFVMVYPKVLALEGYDVESPRPIGEIRLAHRLFEDPTRISGIRPYAPGDAINRIHWRATARAGTLQSKTFEATCVAGATIVLDFHASSFLPRAQDYCSELAVTLAATLTQALCQIGQQVGFVSNGRDAVERMKLQGWDLSFKTRDVAQRSAQQQKENRRLTPVVVETRRDPLQFQSVLETLARLELSQEFLFPDMLADAAPRLPRSASVVAIVSQVTPETAAALGNLQRRGYSVLALVVTFGEPEHPNWAAPPEWAERLLGEGISFRAIADEASVVSFCNQMMVRR